RILTNPEHPVQLVLAGKAHPADLAGQAMIQQWHQFLIRPDIRSHVAFLSELDGWWAEAYAPEVGWAIGDGKEHGDDPNVDAAEAEELYALLEREIVPKFYQRDQQGIPTGWIAM